MFQTCASVPTSGHLEALTRWRGLCGQPTNPIEEYQRGEAAASPLVLFTLFAFGSDFLTKYSDYFPLATPIGVEKQHTRGTRTEM